MHANLGIMEPQGGLLKAVHSKNGKKMVLYCGFVGIVRFFYTLCLGDY